MSFACLRVKDVPFPDAVDKYLQSELNAAWEACVDGLKT